MSDKGQRKGAILAFVCGYQPGIEARLDALQAACEAALGEPVEIRLIDALEDPEAAERYHVLATPLVVREEPPPEHRVIGDLENAQKTSEQLGIKPNKS